MKKAIRLMAICLFALILTSCEVVLGTLLYTLGAMSMPYAPMGNSYNYQSFGSYPSYGSYTDSSSSSSSSSSSVCYVCKGTGRVVKLTYAGSGAKDKYCSECGKTVPAGHYHTRCTSCNGTGHR